MDSLLSFFMTFGPQHWVVIGLILLIAEMSTGTTYLLWPAVAAFVTALISWSGATTWLVDVGIFAILVIVLTYLGRPLVQKWRREGAASGLNERAQTLIGTRGLMMSFADGVGSVKVNDTVWRAVSDEALEAGQHVEVTAVDGVTLKVKRFA
jgi:membrane protein implicated in regulation of membrane protease activity